MDAIVVDQPVDLAVVGVGKANVKCKQPGPANGTLTLRSRPGDIVPGEIVTVLPSEIGRRAGRRYVVGEIKAVRLDAPALGLAPLKLNSCGMWNPAEEYWGEDGEPVRDWARPILAKGPRPAHEMEQVVPAGDFQDFPGPIVEAVELRQCGDISSARAILMDLLESDLRCLDAHAHLGSFALDRTPEKARKHFEVGVAIGQLTLGDGFDGVLPWGLIDNRPFLRCLHGDGLSLWRVGEFDEAIQVMERMLWLNPSDNQGVRFLLPDLRSGLSWKETNALS